MRMEVSKDKPTVNKIIEAATRLFAVKGYAAVSVKELADAAGVNIALISYYFGGKESLYKLVLERQFDPVDSRLSELEQAEKSPLEKIREFAKIIAQCCIDNASGDRLFLSEVINPTACFDSVVRTRVARLHRFLRDCIKQAMELGQFRPGLDPDYAAQALGHAIRFHLGARHFAKDLLPDRENQAEYYANHALDIFLFGVLAPAASERSNFEPFSKSTACSV